MSRTTNYGDPYTHKMTLRLTDKQLEYVVALSNILGVTPSEYIRMQINAGMVAYQSSNFQNMINGNFTEQQTKEGTSHENVETNQHNLIQQ